MLFLPFPYASVALGDVCRAIWLFRSTLDSWSCCCLKADSFLMDAHRKHTGFSSALYLSCWNIPFLWWSISIHVSFTSEYHKPWTATFIVLCKIITKRIVWLMQRNAPRQVAVETGSGHYDFPHERTRWNKIRTLLLLLSTRNIESRAITDSFISFDVFHSIEFVCDCWL